jgi:hypothetical protein
MSWKGVDEDILDMFAEASGARGHTRRAGNQAASPVRTFEFGELQAARFGLRTSKKAKSAEAREFARYYLRKWKRAVKADPVKAARYRAMACAYARKGWVRLKADPKRAAHRKKLKAASYARHRTEIRARVNAATTPSMRKQWHETAKSKAAADKTRALHEKALAKGRRERWYAGLKADPARYKKFLARSVKGLKRRYAAKHADSPKRRTPRRCRECRDFGHNRRTCPALGTITCTPARAA